MINAATTPATLPNWLATPAPPVAATHNLPPPAMRNSKRWLVHRKKQPFYVNGAPRNGSLDSPEDTARLGTYADALAALNAGNFDGLGFALGAGWQGIDLDKVEANGLTELLAELPGYVERSPSGLGWHAIGFGRAFSTLGANSTGLEAYSGKRYFTFTGDQGRGEPTDIADFVEQRIAPLHGKASPIDSNKNSIGTTLAEGGRNHALTSLAGTMRSRGLSEAAIEAALLAENLARCNPPLPESEVRRIAHSVGRYPITNDVALDDASGLFNAVPDEIDWPEPLPIPGLPAVPPFDLALLPAALRPWIADIAKRLQVPADMPAMSAVTALSSVIGRRFQIRPKAHDHWPVTPNLWGMVVAPPGFKKSPAIGQTMTPLHKLERQAHKEHEAAMASWLMDKERVNLSNSAAKSVATQQLKKDPNAEVVNLTPEPEEPTPKRYIVNNFSLEALAEVQISNPTGVLAFGDELYGLLKMADKPGNEELNSFLLTAWNGDEGFTFDRIGRGRRYVEYVCISILGGIQPGRLQEYLTFGGSGGAIDSGFLNRFQLMTWPDMPEEYNYIDQVPDKAAEAAYLAVFERVAGVNQFPSYEPASVPCDGPDVRQFDHHAQMVFQEWLEGNERLCRSDTLPPVLTSHLSKFASLVPSLALIFAVADDVKGSIPVRYVDQAIGWAAYLRKHAERVFACTTRPDTVHAKAMLEKIKQGAVKDGFNARDVYHKDWSLLHREGVEKAVALLCDLDYLWKGEQVPTGKGRPPGATYRINPKVMP
jgi:hypothetical protein